MSLAAPSARGNVRIAMQTEQQASEQKPKREYNFKPGRSGNPAGRMDGKRRREIFAALAAELGGEASLSASQRLIVGQVADLKASVGKRDQVRVANTVAKLMRLLGLTAKARPARSALAEYLAKAAPHG
jgi:hypothetical protein